ncbi:hypothetical protein LZG74_11395 [Dyadobacter sp. CY327]|uniref:hypothetical protein n=1 Tax=Dyadobacter sp. CY327 TaxID=2907301 RepID=UPI001F1E9C83|nr:hypothetical protein [Dyadobacter sp. CY327]MCE7070912.1 hypothetical protein [Dyadobacter sp. CY327]
MSEYKKHVDSLPDKVDKTSIYDYENDTLSKVFEGFFNFCSTNIKTEWPKFDVARCGFFYRDQAVNNAMAVKSGTDIWIEVNNHLLESLYKKFNVEKKAVIESLPEAALLKNVVPDDNLPYLMFQSTTMFLYYHELGHILQYDKTDINQRLSENAAAGTAAQFSLERHAREMDSDEFAANFLYEQIKHYFNILNEETKSREILMALITTGIAAIFVLFEMLSRGFNLPIYFEERTHPNTLIRVIGISGIILSKATADFGEKYAVTQPEVIKRSFEIVFNLLEFEASIGNFFEAIKNERVNIVAYSSKVMQLRNSLTWMAGVKLAALNSNSSN